MPLREALGRALSLAGPLGISRVTDITRLDRVGLPVFASVRPAAAPGSLCVNAGKGLSAGEARVGAFMEAIEFAMAESQRSVVKVRSVPARFVLDGSMRDDAILDLCPLAGRSIPLDERIPCVVARDLRGSGVHVPAELVFFPFPLPRQQTFFGATTNGLASGATLTEATVHGLLEVIERDIASFEWLGRESQCVALATLSEKHRRVITRLSGRGMDVAIRWLPNEYQIPCFHAVLWERNRLDPIFTTDGYGCHLDPELALTRALTEAAQGRLTFIHGARDDIAERHEIFKGWKESRKRLYARRLLARARRDTPPFDVETVSNGAIGLKTLDELLSRIVTPLARAGMTQILRVVLTRPKSPVVVVRMIVPLLEYFTPRTPRVGRRLAAFASRV